MEWIKKIYIYTAVGIGLVLIIIASVQLIDLGLRAWVFTKADVNYPYPVRVATPEKTDQAVTEPSPEEVATYQKNDLTSRRQRRASSAIAMLIVGIPLFLYHWRFAKKDFS